MTMPNSYTLKPNSLKEYFESIHGAQPPERFTNKFLENLGYTSTNDRVFIAILKDLGFLNEDGNPQQRYYDYLDATQSGRVLAEAIEDMFSDLFAVNKKAHTMSVEEVKNKMRTLYTGSKTDNIIGRIAKTFEKLCELADFNQKKVEARETTVVSEQVSPDGSEDKKQKEQGSRKSLHIQGLQYHINIVLPESRDQAIYDAIFKSLRDHLGQ